MPSERADKPPAASDFLAAERTFLAWIRTSLALMGFGFVVARFGLFLRELEMSATHASARPTSTLSLWIGTLLLGVGVAVAILSLWRHLHLMDQLNHGGEAFRRPSATAIAIAVLLAVSGIVLMLYLVLVRQSG